MEICFKINLKSLVTAFGKAFELYSLDATLNLAPAGSLFILASVLSTVFQNHFEPLTQIWWKELYYHLLLFSLVHLQVYEYHFGTTHPQFHLTT